MSETDKINILLVDDQPAKLLSYEVILHDLGENLLKASSGNEALEHLLKTDVAIVLVDVCMPELDGFELAAMIRDHPRCQKTAIIFISAVHLADVDHLRGYEMGAVDYVPVPVVPQVLRAKVRIFAELYRKTRQLEQLNRDLEDRVAERTAELETYARRLLESERRRSLALTAGKMGSWDWDLISGDCVWDEGQHHIFGVDPREFKVTPERLRALLHPEDWDRLRHAWVQAGATALTYETEFRVRRPNGAVRWCSGVAAATRDAEGRINRISGVTLDITDRKQAEERQTVLAREVDHRARNVLAVVQSMLRLTKADAYEDYRAAVEGRISALSRAHMLLSERRWEGANLRRIADEELSPYRDGDNETIVVSGPDLLLEPRCAQTVALALHELATNAAKHGALTVSSGRIKLGWRYEHDNVVVEWRETEGPSVLVPSVRGYGLRVIGASVEQLGGRAEFDWKPEGLRCTLSLPSPQKASHPENSFKRPYADEELSPAISPVNGGKCILLVEDESLVAMMITEALIDLGFIVIGPYRTTAEATRALATTPVAAALLDINLGNELVYPVADLLVSCRIPFAFVTGYASDAVAPRYAGAPVLVKPLDRDALRKLFAQGSDGLALTEPRGQQRKRAHAPTAL